MKADDKSRDEIMALVTETYRRLSTPGSNPAELFAHADMALAGSTLNELHYGPDSVKDLIAHVETWGLKWKCEKVTVWREGDVAWVQILSSIKDFRTEPMKEFPYRTTGIFVREDDGWHWRYWGGSEPQPD